MAFHVLVPVYGLRPHHLGLRAFVSAEVLLSLHFQPRDCCLTCWCHTLQPSRFSCGRYIVRKRNRNELLATFIVRSKSTTIQGAFETPIDSVCKYIMMARII